MRVLALIGTVMLAARAMAIEHVSFERDGDERHVVGEVVVEDEEGGILLRSPDNALWIIPREQIVRRSSDQRPFELLSDAAMAERLLGELPAGFQIHQTAHYTICYNTSEAYAQWCGALYERLHRAFYGFWKNRGVTLEYSEQRLVALVFDGRASFERYSRPTLGDAASAMMGYYDMQSNRVTMYDLTGADGVGQARGGSSAAHINRILSQPAAERTVATIVHEATHQLAYNSGLQTRYADNPNWVSEGIAVYFETPDLRSSRGWRGIGDVHPMHLGQFQRSLGKRSDDPLMSLLTDDVRFRSSRTSSQAYADAWALNYYLLRTHRNQYVQYLQQLAGQTPLVEQTQAQRVARLREALGEDLEQLSQQWQRVHAARAVATRLQLEAGHGHGNFGDIAPLVRVRAQLHVRGEQFVPFHQLAGIAGLATHDRHQGAE